MDKRLLIVAPIFFALSSCMPYVKGSVARTMVSSNFEFKSDIRVAVLPFVEKGKPDKDVNIAATDRFSTELMGLGFTVVERVALESVLAELRLNYIGILSDENRKEVGKMLSADLLVFGTLTYVFEPGSQTSVPMVNFATGQNMGYVSETTESSYELSSGSVRIVDVETGEVKISSYSDSIMGHSLTGEIAESIRQRLGQIR